MYHDVMITQVVKAVCLTNNVTSRPIDFSEKQNIKQAHMCIHNYSRMS